MTKKQILAIAKSIMIMEGEYSAVTGPRLSLRGASVLPAPAAVKKPRGKKATVRAK